MLGTSGKFLKAQGQGHGRMRFRDEYLYQQLGLFWLRSAKTRLSGSDSTEPVEVFPLPEGPSNAHRPPAYDRWSLYLDL